MRWVRFAPGARGVGFCGPVWVFVARGRQEEARGSCSWRSWRLGGDPDCWFAHKASLLRVVLRRRRAPRATEIGDLGWAGGYGRRFFRIVVSRVARRVSHMRSAIYVTDLPAVGGQG